MIGLMAAIAILMILSGVAAQRWTDVLRRDKEAEMMFRAEEIAQALFQYRRDRGTLPTELKQLLEPGSKGQYFIRQLYTDPLVKDGKWGLLYANPQGGVLDPNSGSMESGPQIGAAGLTATERPVAGLEQGMRTNTGSVEIGGLQIAGVRTLCKDTPFRVYKDQSEYALWFFTVFDVEHRRQTVGQPGSQPGRGGAPTPGSRVPSPPTPRGGPTGPGGR